MKTEISRDSHQPDKRYTGVYQQQGRMLTDADWNELVEILKDRLKESLKDIVGNQAGSVGATPRHRALQLIADGSESFRLQPGQIYIDGDYATLPGSSDIAYDAQDDFPTPPSKPDSGTNYYVYADIWERTVTQLYDPRIRDKALHGADTCTRKQSMVQIKWCEESIEPEDNEQNPSKGNAELSLTLTSKTTDADTCDPCVSELDIDSRVGNYLFRVEIHDVKEDADNLTEITLKWSSENGAEQYIALADKAQMPEGFITDKWNYEFYDEHCEKHLGVHHDGTWQPARGMLKHIKPPTNTYEIPEITGSNNPDKVYIRRWDGFCTLDLTNNLIVTGYDKDAVLSLSDDNNWGDVVLNTSVTINLSAITLELTLDGHQFVAGDYWIVDVRESEHDPDDNDELLVNQLPVGINHHYLKLGYVEDEVLHNNPEIDRKLSFPSLSEMTRIFSAGGDGQEVIPGQPLPQNLRVGVANGEWPVVGATVRFIIEAGNGSLNPVDGIVVTDSNGIAECEWVTGGVLANDYRVKASLVNPVDPSNALSDYKPPIYFYADIVNADQVAYQAVCSPSTTNTIHNNLTTDGLISVGPDNYYTVKEILDTVLCQLKAEHIPYDPNMTQTISDRWGDINLEELGATPLNIQSAIDVLLQNLHSEDITYELPTCTESNTLKDYIEGDIQHSEGDAGSRYRVSAMWDALLCHLDAAKIPYNPLNEVYRWADILEQRPLATDWVINFGGSSNDNVRDIALDSDGNIVIVGSYSNSINFGGANLTSSGGSDIYLAKFTAEGEHVWSTDLGSVANDSGQNLVIDSAGNVILVAGFTGTVNLGDCGTYTSNGQNDIIVVQFDSDTADCQWVQHFGGTANDLGYALALDSDNNLILAGFFSGEMDIGEDHLTSQGLADIFLAKLDASDNGNPQWANNFGSNRYDVAYNVCVDSENNIIVTGMFQETMTFDGGEISLTSQGKSDIFVAQFDSNGNAIWASQFGSSRSDYGRGLYIDSNDDIYLTGYFQQQINFGEDGDELQASDGYDIYIAKLNRNGHHIWSRTFAGTDADQGHAINVTTDGTLVLSGFFSGQINFGGQDLLSAGEYDGFLAFFKSDATHLYSESLGGVGSDKAVQIATGSDNSLVMTGTFRNSATIAGTVINSSGDSDIFISKFVTPSTGPVTIQEAIDTLVSDIESSDIGYQIPPCTNTVDSVRKRLPSIKNLPDNANSSLLEILNILLCELDADTIPLDSATGNESISDVLVKNNDAQTITGPLTIDDGPTTPSTSKLLDVKGVVETQGLILNSGAMINGSVITFNSTTGMGEWRIPTTEGWDISANNIYSNINGDLDVNIGIGTQTPVDRLEIDNGGVVVRGNRDISHSGGNLLFNSDWKFDKDGIEIFSGDINNLMISTVNDSPQGGNVLRVSGANYFVMGDLIPLDENALYVFQIVARQTTAPSNPLTNRIYFGAAGYLEDGVTRCNGAGADSYGGQHYIGVNNTPLSTQWSFFTGYISGKNAAGTTSRRADFNQPGAFHSDVRYFRPITYINYNSGDGVAEIASVQVYKLPDEFSLRDHEHSNYSLSGHQHNNYSLTTHQHDDYLRKKYGLLPWFNALEPSSQIEMTGFTGGEIINIAYQTMAGSVKSPQIYRNGFYHRYIYVWLDDSDDRWYIRNAHPSQKLFVVVSNFEVINV